MKSKTSRITTFKNMLNSIFTENEIETLVLELDKMDFFTAPASTRYHGNYEGGLFDHSFEVTIALLDFTEKLGLTWQRSASPYIVGLFHDLCKTDNYVLTENGTYIFFEPDNTLFKDYSFNSEYVETMLRNYTYLNTGLSLIYNGRKIGTHRFKIVTLSNADYSARPDVDYSNYEEVKRVFQIKEK